MNKTIVRRVSVLFFGLLCLLFVLAQVAVAQEKPVTSEKLSIEDVKPHLDKAWKGQGITVQKVFGIHQKENDATVYMLLGGIPGMSQRESKLVRFNSGEWFDTHFFRVLTK